MSSSKLFTLSRWSEAKLRDDLQTYFGLFRVTKCSGSHLEELLVRALEADPLCADNVEWHAGSHNALADIYLAHLNRLSLSVKSGTILCNPPQHISISGHRLTQYRRDFNQINMALKARISDVLVCFLHAPTQACYQVIYIDRSVFVYPDRAESWQSKIGSKNGRVSEAIWRNPGGLITVVRFPLSDQVWWTIPLRLCRVGPTIHYGQPAREYL